MDSSSFNCLFYVNLTVQMDSGSNIRIIHIPYEHQQHLNLHHHQLVSILSLAWIPGKKACLMDA